MRTAARFLAVLAGLFVVIAAGISAIIFGAGDDSPGLQALGGCLIMAAVAVALRIPPETVGLRRGADPAAANR